MSSDGHLIEVADMPIVEVRGKKRVSAQGVNAIFERRIVSLVVIEGIHAFSKGSVSSMLAFGYAAGLLEGVAAGQGYPVEIVRASVWKRKAAAPADKGAARQMAARLWPGAADQFKRVKDDGRADAALLARWAATSRIEEALE